MVSSDLSTDLGWGILSSAGGPGDDGPPRPQGEIKVRRRARQEPEKTENDNDDAQNEDGLTALDAGDPGHRIDRLA